MRWCKEDPQSRQSVWDPHPWWPKWWWASKGSYHRWGHFAQPTDTDANPGLVVTVRYPPALCTWWRIFEDNEVAELYPHLKVMVMWIRSLNWFTTSILSSRHQCNNYNGTQIFQS